MLSEEQEEHDRTDKKLMKTKRDLEDAKHELSELRKVFSNHFFPNPIFITNWHFITKFVFRNMLPSTEY